MNANSRTSNCSKKCISLRTTHMKEKIKKIKKKQVLSDIGNPSIFIKYLGYLRKEEIAKD